MLVGEAFVETVPVQVVFVVIQNFVWLFHGIYIKYYDYNLLMKSHEQKV